MIPRSVAIINQQVEYRQPLGGKGTLLALGGGQHFFVSFARGRIVVVVSRAALDVAAGQAAYQVSKAAALRLTEVMARELARHRIGVDAVLPGTMDTPANRAAMPKADRSGWLPLPEVAGVIASLLGDEPSLTGRAVVLPTP